MKKKILLGVIISILLISTVCIIFGTKSSDNEIQVTFFNKTSENIYNLYITYTDSNHDISIPCITPNGKETVTIDLPNNFSEGNITLYYYNSNNVKQEIVIIGYIEKGYHYNTTFTIVSVDNDGILHITD